MLPSTLSIAFPGENPAPNRASGVMVPVFTLAAVPLTAFLSWARNRWAENRGLLLSYFFVGSLLFISLRINSQLVVKEYGDQNRSIMLNTSEIGQVVRGFADSIGSYDTAHVIPYPYWVDTRAIGILVGKPTKDFALWPDDLPNLATEERSQLFLLHPMDDESLDSLMAIFPDGSSSRWHSQIEGMDFVLYFVPPRGMDWYLKTEPE
jgi:hypothetical protein